MTRQCHGVTRNGKRCKNPARNSKAKYCRRHASSKATSSMLDSGILLDVKNYLKNKVSDENETPRKKQRTQTTVDMSEVLEVLGNFKISFSEANANLMGLPQVLFKKTSGIPRSIMAKMVRVNGNTRTYDIRPIGHAKIGLKENRYEEKKFIRKNDFQLKYSISIRSDEDENEKEMKFKYQLISIKGPKREILVSLTLNDSDSDDDDEKGLTGYFSIQGFDEGFEDAVKAESENPFPGY